MKKHILICIFFLASFAFLQAKTSKINSLLNELDKTLDKKGEYEFIKDEEIKLFIFELHNSTSDDEWFSNIDRLFKSYLYYNMDSALFYLRIQSDFVPRFKENEYLIKYKLNTISFYLQTGMYHEALQIQSTINHNNLDLVQRSEYLDLSIRLYSALLQNISYEIDENNYSSIITKYREELLTLNDSLATSNLFVYSDLLIEAGKYEQARFFLENQISESEMSNHQQAIKYHLISQTWIGEGNRTKAKESLIMSSIYDIKSSVKEYISLWQLAEMLYEDGDIDRAYKYLKISLQDASISNIRLRTNKISQIYPIIESTYQAKVEKQQKQLYNALVMISVLAIFLLLFLWLFYKQILKLRLIRKELKIRNSNLNELNISLIDSSLIKEEYIGKYMEQSLIYLEKIEEYRRWVRKSLQNSSKSEFIEELKQSNIVEEELNLFFQEFDKTFLNLFPTFIDDYYSLLIPEERHNKSKDKLDTELRIYALIRLGITDSDKIAKLLGYSISTIYNYRTKARNKYLGDRDQFEDRVREIGIKRTSL